MTGSRVSVTSLVNDPLGGGAAAVTSSVNNPLADPLEGPDVAPTANQLTGVAAAGQKKQTEDDWKRLRHEVVAEQEESAVAGGGGAGDITADLELKHTQLMQACYGHVFRTNMFPY